MKKVYISLFLGPHVIETPLVHLQGHRAVPHFSRLTMKTFNEESISYENICLKSGAASSQYTFRTLE